MWPRKGIKLRHLQKFHGLGNRKKKKEPIMLEERVEETESRNKRSRFWFILVCTMLQILEPK